MKRRKRVSGKRRRSANGTYRQGRPSRALEEHSQTSEPCTEEITSNARNHSSGSSAPTFEEPLLRPAGKEDVARSRKSRTNNAQPLPLKQEHETEVGTPRITAGKSLTKNVGTPRIHSATSDTNVDTSKADDSAVAANGLTRMTDEDRGEIIIDARVPNAEGCLYGQLDFSGVKPRTSVIKDLPSTDYAQIDFNAPPPPLLEDSD
ncbi:uncharacterized protein [Littorina saxatilis]|uniref:uncharacterized protein n=1 Tax=Littorina saxatilis TaxID=31220 RepID=UPI0038B605A0